MIKPSELRIGNLAIDIHSGRYLRVIRLGEGVIEFDVTDGGGLKGKWQSNGIPLTSDILGKTGFSPCTCKGWVSNTDMKHLHIQKDMSFDSGGYKLEYLHQLQNLYFALTGEELKIEL